jgi:hypothetical protein
VRQPSAGDGEFGVIAVTGDELAYAVNPEVLAKQVVADWNLVYGRVEGEVPPDDLQLFAGISGHTKSFDLWLSEIAEAAATVPW